MFFYIGDNKPFDSLQQVHTRLYLDRGWDKLTINDKKVWYKGYSTDCKLSDSVDKILQGYKPSGKWCVIDTDYNIYHPVLRGFPLFEYENKLTNFKLPGFYPVVYEHDYSGIFENISSEDAVSKIKNILLENTENFLRYNQLPNLHICFTGGLDSLTSWTILHRVTKNYKLFVKPPEGIKKYETDLFPFLNYHWGYKISNLYNYDNYNVTGFYGERITFREVDTAHVLSNYLGNKVIDTLSETDYLFHFMKRPSSLINHYPKLSSEIDVKKWCYDRVFYDYQIWHLDNNYMFCPFYDLRISKIMHGLSINDLSDNQKNGTIQRKVIEKIDPNMLLLLSDYKNHGNVWKNFDRNFLKLSKHFTKQLGH